MKDTRFEIGKNDWCFAVVMAAVFLVIVGSVIEGARDLAGRGDATAASKPPAARVATARVAPPLAEAGRP